MVPPSTARPSGRADGVELALGGAVELGKRIELDGALVVPPRIRDGEVLSFQQYVDTAQMQEVTGSR